MKDIIENIFGFLYTLSMGDYIFFIGTFIILLAFLYVLYLMNRDDDMGVLYNSDDITSIESIKETIEREYKPGNIELTDYEKEQEENAIISYEELIKSKDKYAVSYDEEYKAETDEISIRKISVDEGNVKSEETSGLQVKLMSYDKEEAFLTALKQLQQNLAN